MTRALAHLLLDTLRLTPEGDRDDLAARWSRPEIAARTEAIAAWIAWEQGEQWLLRRLATARVLAEAPVDLVEGLRAGARRDAMAAMTADADAADAVRVITAQGVPCMLLKGPARRASASSLTLADARLTRDVDVLVPARDGERLWHQFRSRGYAPFEYDPANLPPGESEVQGPSPYHLRTLVREGAAAVELHLSTERGLPPAVAWNRLWSSARTVSWQGLEVRVPSFTELLWQAITHADVTWTAGWSLRYWLDAASVLAAQPVEWETILARLQSMSPWERALAFRWLAVAIRLAGTPLPPAVARVAPLDFLGLVTWRLAMLTRFRRSASWRQKLLDEATRAEAGLGLAPLVGGRAWPVHARRRAATLAARAAYLAWRLPQRDRSAAGSSGAGRPRVHPASEP